MTISRKQLREYAARIFCDKAGNIAGLREARGWAEANGESREFLELLDQRIARAEAAPERTYEEVLAQLVERDRLEGIE